MSNESSLGDRIEKLEADVKELRDKVLGDQELRKLGIEKGSAGVKGAFILVGLIVVVTALYQYFTGTELIGPLYLLGFGGIVTFALVAYFGFIFKYTISAKVDPKTGVQAETREG